MHRSARNLSGMGDFKLENYELRDSLNIKYCKLLYKMAYIMNYNHS